MPPKVSKYLQSKEGFSRIVLVGSNLLCVMTVSIAVANSNWIYFRMRCSQWICPPPWLAHVGLSFVVLTCLFTIAMFVGAAVLKRTTNIRFRKVDFLGHLFCGVSLITAFAIFMAFMVLGLLHVPCEDSDDSLENKNELQNHLRPDDCKTDKSKLSKDKPFQPALFGISGIPTLGSGILAIYLAMLVKMSTEHEPLPGVSMSTRNQVRR